MQQRQLNIDGFRISYLEQNPNGESCVFFIHGNSNSGRLWKDEFSDPYFNDYHLIAIDLPGHGNSSFSVQPLKDYSVKALAELMAKFIKALNINKAYFLCGFSLGTNVIAEMLAFAIDPVALILSSPSLVGGKIGPGDLNDKEIVGRVLFDANENNESVDEYFDIALPKDSIAEKKDLINDYKNTDKQFRQALMQTAINGEFSDEIELLNTSDLPTLMVISSDDEVVRTGIYDTANLFMPNVMQVKMAGGHYLPLEAPEILNPLVLDFINKIKNTQH